MVLAQAGRQLTVVAVPIQIYPHHRFHARRGSARSGSAHSLAAHISRRRCARRCRSIGASCCSRRGRPCAHRVWACGGIRLPTNRFVWPLYVLSGINAGIAAIHNPARQALLPGLVGRELFPAALALNQTQTNVAKTAVPAVGGLLIAAADLPATYLVQTILFVLSGLAILQIPNVPTEGGGRTFSVESIREGIDFLKSRRLIQAAMLIDLNAMVFGMPTALFPAFGENVLGGDEFTVGLLFRRAGCWGDARRSHLRLGSEGAPSGSGCGDRGVVLGVGHRGVRPVAQHRVRVRDAHVRRCRRCCIGDLSSVDDSALGARRHAGSPRLDPHAASGGGPRLGDLEAGWLPRSRRFVFRSCPAVLLVRSVRLRSVAGVPSSTSTSTRPNFRRDRR